MPPFSTLRATAVRLPPRRPEKFLADRAAPAAAKAMDGDQSLSTSDKN
jgi:hypothetical protein